MTDLPAGTSYKGPSGIARNSNWLTNEDIPHDRDTVVVIESVQLRRNLTMQGGRPKDIALSIKFVGKSRELMVNATHRKTLAMLFGSPQCDAWYGKTIALFVEQGIRRPDGTTGPAVRIRNKHPKPDGAAKAAPQAPTLPDAEADFRGDAEIAGGDA